MQYNNYYLFHIKLYVEVRIFHNQNTYVKGEILILTQNVFKLQPIKK